jgi:hypothetical protein
MGIVQHVPKNVVCWLTKYMNYGHWVVVVLVSSIWAKCCPKVKSVPIDR